MEEFRGVKSAHGALESPLEGGFHRLDQPEDRDVVLCCYDEKIGILMDVSIFIANKRRLWTWVLLPLVIRFVLVSVVFGVTEKKLAGFNKEIAAAEVIGPLKVECELNEKLMNQFKADEHFPINEQLYQFIAEKNNEYGLALSADVDAKEIKKSKVVKYRMKVEGEVPSIYLISNLISDVLGDPMVVLRDCEYKITKGASAASNEESQRALELSCEFERLALSQRVGK